MSLDDGMKALSINERLSLLDGIRKETEMITKLWKYDGPLSYTFRKVRFLTDETTLEGLKEVVTTQYLSGLLGKITGPLEFKPIDSGVYDVVVAVSLLAKLEKKLKLQLSTEWEVIKMAPEEKLTSTKEEISKRLVIITKEMDLLNETTEETEGSDGIPVPFDTYTAYAMDRLNEWVVIRETAFKLVHLDRNIRLVTFDDCETPLAIIKKYESIIQPLSDIEYNMLEEGKTDNEDEVTFLRGDRYKEFVNNAARVRIQVLWSPLKIKIQTVLSETYTMAIENGGDDYRSMLWKDYEVWVSQLAKLSSHLEFADDWKALFTLVKFPVVVTSKEPWVTDPFANDEFIHFTHVISRFCSTFNMNTKDQIVPLWLKTQKTLEIQIRRLNSQANSQLLCRIQHEMDLFATEQEVLERLSIVMSLQPQGTPMIKMIGDRIVELKLKGDTVLNPLQPNAKEKFGDFLRDLNTWVSETPKPPKPQGVIAKLSAQVMKIPESDKGDGIKRADAFLLNELLDNHYRIMYLSDFPEPQPIFVDTYAKLKTYMGNRPELFIGANVDLIRNKIPSEWLNVFKNLREMIWDLTGRNHFKSLVLTAEQKKHPELKLLPAIVKAVFVVFHKLVDDSPGILDRIGGILIDPETKIQMGGVDQLTANFVTRFAATTNAADITDFFRVLGGRFLSSFITWEVFNGNAKEPIIEFKSLTKVKQLQCLQHAWDYVFSRIMVRDILDVGMEELKFANQDIQRYYICVLEFQRFIARNDMYLYTVMEKDNNFDYLFEKANEVCAFDQFPMEFHPVYLMICRLQVPPYYIFQGNNGYIVQFGLLMQHWQDERNHTLEINDIPSPIWKIFKSYEKNRFFKKQQKLGLGMSEKDIMKIIGPPLSGSNFKANEEGLSALWRMVFDLVTLEIFEICEKRSENPNLACQLSNTGINKLLGSLYVEPPDFPVLLLHSPYAFDFINIFAYLVYSRHVYILNPSNESTIHEKMRVGWNYAVPGDMQTYSRELCVFDAITKKQKDESPLVHIQEYCQAKQAIIQQYWMPKIEDCLKKTEMKEFIKLIRWCRERIGTAYAHEWLVEWKINLRTDRQVLEAYLVLFDDYRIWSDHSEFVQILHKILNIPIPKPIIDMSTFVKPISEYFGEFFTFGIYKDMSLSRLQYIFPRYDPKEILSTYSKAYENKETDKIIEEGILPDNIIED